MKQLLSILMIFILLVGHSIVFAQNGSQPQQSTTATTNQPGTPGYYNDDSVRYNAKGYKVVKNALHEVTIGGDPQVKGGLTTPPLADEEDVLNDRVRQVEIMSGKGILYVGELPKEITMPDGTKVPVKIRRKKTTKKILVVINCGNWVRELSEGEKIIIKNETQYKDCVPGAEEFLERQVLDDGTVLKIYTDGCNKIFRYYKTITNNAQQQQQKPCPCDPNALVKVVKQGIEVGKLNDSPTFDLISAIPSDVRDAVLAQHPGLKKLKKVRFLYIERGICEETKNLFQVIALDTKGNKLIFALGVALGAGLGYGISKIGGGNSGPDKPPSPPVRPVANPFGGK